MLYFNLANSFCSYKHKINSRYRWSCNLSCQHICCMYIYMLWVHVWFKVCLSSQSSAVTQIACCSHHRMSGSAMVDVCSLKYNTRFAFEKQYFFQTVFWSQPSFHGHLHCFWILGEIFDSSIHTCNDSQKVYLRPHHHQAAICGCPTWEVVSSEWDWAGCVSWPALCEMNLLTFQRVHSSLACLSQQPNVSRRLTFPWGHQPNELTWTAVGVGKRDLGSPSQSTC